MASFWFTAKNIEVPPTNKNPKRPIQNNLRPGSSILDFFDEMKRNKTTQMALSV